MEPVKEKNVGSRGAVILGRMAREELSGEVTFETSEEANHAPSWVGGSVTGRKKSKDPEARVCLVNLRNSKEASVAEVWWEVGVEESTAKAWSSRVR